MSSISAELMRPPAPALPDTYAAALTEAIAAFRRLNRSTDLREDTVALLGPLSDMQVLFEVGGHHVQARHVADALGAMVADQVAGTGEWDEETLERERWRRIDQAVECLQAALSAHVWRAVMPIEVREANSSRIQEPA